MTISEALRAAAAMGLPRLDAQLLLLHALGRPVSDRAWLIAHDGNVLDTRQRTAFTALCQRRAGGEPAAYLLGHKEFYGLSLRVDARVLVPRPDTETLVAWALEVLRPVPAPSVIDLGTGSGAIALAIKHARPDARVRAVDASAGALELARENAGALGLPVEFAQGHWLEGEGRYDLIVSNPPYVREHDAHLDALGHEPRQALAAGPDGLADLRVIVATAPGHLEPGGWLLLEHGWDQAGEVRSLLVQGGFSDLQSRRDLAGIERCSGGRRLELG
jgi:release factor glutamine methyltransferase